MTYMGLGKNTLGQRVEHEVLVVVAEVSSERPRLDDGEVLRRFERPRPEVHLESDVPERLLRDGNR